MSGISAVSESVPLLGLRPVQMKAEGAPQVEQPEPSLADPLEDPLQMLAGGGGGGGGGAAPSGPPPDDGPYSPGLSLLQMLALSPMVQRSGGAGTAGVQRAASEGLAGSGSRYPFASQIQQSFGRHDISGIRAHTDAGAGEAASAMGARAFASGSEVGFGGTPDLHTAAHEAAHTIQQQGGVQLKGGVGQAGDVYERNADAVADAVVQGKSAESLLDPFAGGSGGGGGVQLDPKGTPSGKPSATGANQKDLSSGDAENKGADIKLANSTEYELKLDVPVWPGFTVHAAVTAEMGKEKQLNKGGLKGQFLDAGGDKKNTVTTLKLNAKLGGGFSVLFFKVHVFLFGQLEAEVPGDKGLIDMITTAANESIRFFAADKVKGVTDKLKGINGLVEENRTEMNGIINPLIAKIIMDYDYTEKNKSSIKEELTTRSSSWVPWSTALDKVYNRKKSFESALKSKCDLPGAEAEEAAGIVIPFPKIITIMNAMAEKMSGEGRAAAMGARAALNDGRDRITALMNEAANKARESVKQLDFMVPTPGVKVKGQLGGGADVSFSFGSSGAGEAEGEIAGGFQYDTSKTKTEKVDQGDGTFKERTVFDRAAGMQGIAKLKAKIGLAGFGGEMELTGAWNPTDHDYTAAFEANTPPLPLFLSPGDLSKVLGAASGISRQLFAPLAAENPKKDEESKGILTKAKEKITGWYEKIKPEVEAATATKSMVDRGQEMANGPRPATPVDPKSMKGKVLNKAEDLKKKTGFEVKEKPKAGHSSIVVGGTLELHRKLGKWRVGGEVHAGLMQETKVEALGFAEASMKDKEVIKASWDA